jgi:molecular chaperone GrpE
VAPSELEALKQKYEDALKANATQKDMYLRQLAEFENFRKRLAKEQEDFGKYANQKIIEELLPVIDSLEMTLSHCSEEEKKTPLVSGVELTRKQLLQALEKHGVKQYGTEGEPFDPNFEEAIGTEKNESLGPGMVAKVLRKGYTLHGKDIRAAMVVVTE